MNGQIELREDLAGNGKLTLEGYASPHRDPVRSPGLHGDHPSRSVPPEPQEGPDTSLLVNHEGLPIARTTAGTLALAEDENGLRVRAELEPEDPDVQAIAWKMRSGALSEMSMGFRATKQQWNEDRTQRVIHEVALHRGDVSTVSAAASPTSTATLRSVEATLEQRKRMVERIGDRLCGPVGFTFDQHGSSEAPREYVVSHPAGASRGRSRIAVPRSVTRRSHLELAKAYVVKGSRAHPGSAASVDGEEDTPRYTPSQIEALGKRGLAFKRKNGTYSFPIVDRRDLLNAIKAWGRAAPSEASAVKLFIKRRAVILGLDNLLPASWMPRTPMGEPA